MAEYNFSEIEKKWQDTWEKTQLYKADVDPAKPKYYVLDMFPYPSGAGLHVGHPLGYIASDIVARFKRLTGYNVLHPMGFDSFGLPAEQYAIQTGQHPAITTANNIATYTSQLKKLGFAYDWSKEVRTSDPAFYKWTQWIFMQLFNSWYNTDTDKAESIESLVQTFAQSGNASLPAVCDEDTPTFSADKWNTFSVNQQQEILLKYRLTYLANTTVNWCPALGTVLANDEVKDGVSERGGYPVVQKKMTQWSMRITAYAERLLQGLDTIDWPEPIKEMQRNWIGKSLGAEVYFRIIPAPAPEELSGAQSPYHTADKLVWGYLKEFGRKNRKNPTEAENRLWEEMREKKLGYKFRRQHTIGQFIVDFVSLEKKLVVEVDGNVHEGQMEYDRERTEFLKRSGFRVTRFTNQEVTRNLPAVLEAIKRQLDQPALPEAPLAWRGTGSESLTVFTTRPDTIYGVTFMVIAPEHELVPRLTTPEQKAAVDAYVETAKNRSERDRLSDVKTVSGVFTGSYAINPINATPIPIWIADYVLAGYGTGAVMAVPSSDTRDYAFATHFNLPIIPVQEGPHTDIAQPDFDPKAGTMINSDFLNGLPVADALPVAIAELEVLGAGKGKVNYRMRDAVFSRQRYWGEPVPVYFKDGLPYLIDERELPLVLPEIDAYLPTESGDPPLGRATDWKYRPHDTSPSGGGQEGVYELSTMPGWAGSSWYFYRYMDAHNDKEFASREAIQYWRDVDLYLGGSEHATGHLLYSRFWNQFLYDLGLVPEKEYARKLINQGMIQGVSHFAFATAGATDNAMIVLPQGGPKQTPTILAQILYSADYPHRSHFEEEVKERSYLEPSKSMRMERIHIDWVENDQLSVEKFCEKGIHIFPYQTAIFVVNNGYHIVTKHPKSSTQVEGFFDFNDNPSNEKPAPFLTIQEVEKMSKSKYNVVNPNNVVDDYGADTLRLYEMFLGPLEQSKPWNTNGINGVHNFLRKFWRLFHDEAGNVAVSDAQPTADELKSLHKAIKKVQDDIERFSFNTSVSTFMICANELSAMKCNKRAILRDFAIILAPYTPHIAEEVWQLLGHSDSIFKASYPAFNPAYLVEDTFEYPVSVNGKLRAKMTFPLDTAIGDIEKSVLASEQIQKWLEGKPPKKVIVVPKKIVNVVV